VIIVTFLKSIWSYEARPMDILLNAFAFYMQKVLIACTVVLNPEDIGLKLLQ